MNVVPASRVDKWDVLEAIHAEEGVDAALESLDVSKSRRVQRLLRRLRLDGFIDYGRPSRYGCGPRKGAVVTRKGLEKLREKGVDV